MCSNLKVLAHRIKGQDLKVPPFEGPSLTLMQTLRPLPNDNSISVCAEYLITFKELPFRAYR